MRKIKYLTVDPKNLASPLTCEKVREFLDKYGYSCVVIEHPSLLDKEHFEELSKLVNFTYKEVIIKD